MTDLHLPAKNDNKANPEKPTELSGRGASSSEYLFRDEYIRDPGAPAKMRAPRPEKPNQSHGAVLMSAQDRQSSVGESKSGKPVVEEKKANPQTKEPREGSFNLQKSAIAHSTDAKGRVSVNKFDQIPVKTVSVHSAGKISLDLHNETTVKRPNDP